MVRRGYRATGDASRELRFAVVWRALVDTSAARFKLVSELMCVGMVAKPQSLDVNVRAKMTREKAATAKGPERIIENFSFAALG